MQQLMKFEILIQKNTVPHSVLRNNSILKTNRVLSNKKKYINVSSKASRKRKIIPRS